MFLKKRSESEELLVTRSLNIRMEPTEREKFHYKNLEKGYEGEVQFDILVEGIQEERLIIPDLLLEVNNSYFQIDTLIISQGALLLLDIKNFQGDFYLNSDKFYSLKTHREWKNPLDQLKRSTTLLGQLLETLKENYLVDSSLIFINPEFTLYQTPLDQPIIFPTQINRFLNELNKTPSRLNEGHRKLAQKLLSLHQTKNPFAKIPDYSYEQLQKGFYCKRCRSLLVSLKKHHLECKKCGDCEKLEQAIVRHTREFALLFPERKITTQAIYDWCDVDLSKKTFRRVLKKHYTAYDTKNRTYYY